MVSPKETTMLVHQRLPSSQADRAVKRKRLISSPSLSMRSTAATMVANHRRAFLHSGASFSLGLTQKDGPFALCCLVSHMFLNEITPTSASEL